MTKIIHCYYGGFVYEDVNRFLCDERRPGQDLRYAIDDSKLCALGWKPECKFDEELPKIIGHYKERFIW